MKTCERKVDIAIGAEMYKVTCQLKQAHSGGHRAPVGDAPGHITILTWFKENGER